MKNKKTILQKIATLEKQNHKLFEKKGDLEDKILKVDLDIFKIMTEYNKLVAELYNLVDVKLK